MAFVPVVLPGCGCYRGYGGRTEPPENRPAFGYYKHMVDKKTNYRYEVKLYFDKLRDITPIKTYKGLEWELYGIEQDDEFRKVKFNPDTFRIETLYTTFR